MSILLKKGQRGLLVGRTGSGKTQNAIFQLRNAIVSPVIIFDTKIENAFFGLPLEGETMEVVESLKAFEEISKLPRKKLPDYILVRPALDEMQNQESLDEYCEIVYRKFGACFIYFDELYNWHNQGRATDNLIGLLTRGRSKGKTVLMSTQRPAWVSRFCLTETDKFYIHQLTDARDKKSLAEIIPDFAKCANPAKWHFWHYDVTEDSLKLFSPVPFQELDNTRIFKRRWL